MADRDWLAGGRSILELRIGDMVEFLGENGLCQGGLARYTGYVVSMNNQRIGISTMHPFNEFSLTTDEEIGSTKIKEIQLGSISYYRIIRKNDESVDPFNTPKAK